MVKLKKLKDKILYSKAGDFYYFYIHPRIRTCVNYLYVLTKINALSIRKKNDRF
jgi:hypothetical protein